MNKFTIEDLFIKWKADVKGGYGQSRFTKDQREEMIDDLCSNLYENGIDYDEAKFFVKKVQEFLVTREGQKGNGKYKSWMPNIKEEYISHLVVYYENVMEPVNDIAVTKKTITRKVEYYGGTDYIGRIPLMVAWTKHKFKDKWSEAICLEAHKVGSPLWQLFDKEVLSAEWAKSGARPQWAEYVV